MRPRQVGLVPSLMRPIVKVLARTGLTQKELLSGPIEHTELMWQTPPLLAESMLDAVPLHMYFDLRVPQIRAKNVFDFWASALQWLRAAPYRVADDAGWRNLTAVFPQATPGERAYWFSAPKGYPNEIDPYAAVTLSLECAHLLRHATAVESFVENEDDYYVVTKEGFEIGVKNGLPLAEYEQWDIPVNGLVQDLLRMPRGDSFIGCDYDLIAKLRSVLQERRSQVKEFEGTDWALQGLRVLAAGKQLAEVQNRIKLFRVEQASHHRKIKALREALELGDLFSISDRSRVIAIRSLLVPEFMTLSYFRKNIYHADEPPPTLTQQARYKLNQGLRLSLEEELRYVE